MDKFRGRLANFLKVERQKTQQDTVTLGQGIGVQEAQAQGVQVSEEVYRQDSAMEGAMEGVNKEMSIVAQEQLVNKTYQVIEPSESDELVASSPYANIPTDKLVLQLGAADLQSILEEAIEARVEARLAQARKQKSDDNLQPFGSMMSVGQQEEPAPKTVTATHVNNVVQNVNSNVDLKPSLGDMTLTDILSDDEEEELDAVPLRNHDELTRCFECKRKHMTPNGLFMHLTQMHPKCEQLKRLKSTTWCPMCIVNCRHWYNMAMHVCEIHGQRSWWLEDEDEVGDVTVSTCDDVLSSGFRPETPKQSRGKVRQVSMVEYTDPDELLFQDMSIQQKETSPFFTTNDAVVSQDQDQSQILRKSSFGGFFAEAIKEQSAELWDDEMRSLDDRMKQIMESQQSNDTE